MITMMISTVPVRTLPKPLTAALGIGLDGLPVAEDQDGQQADDRRHNGQEDEEGRHGQHRHQHQQDLLSRVADGGDRVAGEDGDAPEDIEFFLAQLGVLQPPPEEKGQEFFFQGIHASLWERKSALRSVTE